MPSRVRGVYVPLSGKRSSKGTAGHFASVVRNVLLVCVKKKEKLGAASRPSGEWSNDDYDVLADGVVAS